MKAAKVLVLFVVIAGAFSMFPDAPAAEPGFSNIPGQPVEPGTTVTLTSTQLFDTGVVTARITQNGAEHVCTFKMDKEHISDSMVAASKCNDSEVLVFATYRDADEVAQLSMTVIYDKTCAGSLATEGLSLKVLVYEMYGNNVTVILNGKKDGADASLNCSFPAGRLTASKVAIGPFMQPLERSYLQNESIPIYALGYNSTVEIVIKNSAGNTVTQMSAESKGMLAHASWKVPLDQTPGTYTVSVKPAGASLDGFGAAGTFSLNLGLEKAIDTNGGGGPRPPSGNRAPISMPVWAPYAMVAAVLIVGVPIGVLLIRKKKD